MYTYLGKWIMVNNNKCECPFLPAHPGKSPLQVSDTGASPGRGKKRAPPQGWHRALAEPGPAQQRSCNASWGCGPSSRAQTSQHRPVLAILRAVGSVLSPQSKTGVMYLVSHSSAQWRIKAVEACCQFVGSVAASTSKYLV